jgi:multidrug efflux pump
MLVSTVLTMYVVPAIYSYISTDRAKKQAAVAAKNN